ncbi:MAG: VOC family protein [bacterium]
MSEKHYNFGHFVWRELLTPAVDEAKAFYGRCALEVQGMEMPGGSTYTVIEAGGKGIGGIMTPPMAGIPPHWMSATRRCPMDAAAESVKAHGGGVMAGPMDISVGRLAVVTDPQGAALTVWKGAEGDGGPPGMPGLGEFCWETLVTPDAEASKAFYTAALGWKAGAGPGGPDMAVFEAAGGAVADIQPSTRAPPHWPMYIVVPEAAAAREAKVGSRWAQGHRAAHRGALRRQHRAHPGSHRRVHRALRAADEHGLSACRRGRAPRMA